MSDSSAPVFGRKVFFLTPPDKTADYIIPRLRELEFEIYVISDYKDGKNILRANPESICFICTEKPLTLSGWMSYARSLEDDPTLSTIHFAILASNMTTSDKAQFSQNAKRIDLGIIDNTGSNIELTKTIGQILMVNGARGRRQSVRASCQHDPTASIVLPTTVGPKAFHIIDISSAGIAALSPKQYSQFFQQNMKFKNVPLNFGSNHVQASFILPLIKAGEKTDSLVLMFTPGTPSNVKSLVREYVAQNLQYEMRMKIDGQQQDTTDYEY